MGKKNNERNLKNKREKRAKKKKKNQNGRIIGLNLAKQRGRRAGGAAGPGCSGPPDRPRSLLFSFVPSGVVRASSIFPILSAILLLLGGVCVAASRVYKSKRNIILGAGILFVAAGERQREGAAGPPADARACLRERVCARDCKASLPRAPPGDRSFSRVFSSSTTSSWVPED